MNEEIVVVQIMDLSAITWSSLDYTAEDLSNQPLPVIVRQRLASRRRSQVSDIVTMCSRWLSKSSHRFTSELVSYTVPYYPRLTRTRVAIALFTARYTLVQSAVLRLHGVRLFVRPSVRLSVTLVDQDHVGWKSWKLTARRISPTSSFFGAQRPSTYSQGNVGKFGGD